MQKFLIDNNYMENTIDILKILLPELTYNELREGIEYSINKRRVDSEISLYNNYKNKRINMTLLEVTDYILSQEPIITSSGVLFKKRSEAKNPIAGMMQRFLALRKINKKEMFKYPKRSSMFEKYNLLQLLNKIDANSMYGCLGASSSIYFNLFCSSSITAQGRSCISSAVMCFESFMDNNIKFMSLNEVVTFINNVMHEAPERIYDDSVVLDRNITYIKCFEKVMFTVGFIPTDSEMDIIFNLIARLNQEDLNRVYYKNNLYEFIDNKYLTNIYIDILSSLEYGFFDPNTPPKEVESKLQFFWNILREYVFYNHIIIDSISRLETQPRSIAMIIDTDSSIVNMDGWYRFILEKVKSIPMNIKQQRIDVFSLLEKDEFGDLTKPIEIFKEIEPLYDYDFINDEIIELERTIDIFKVIPQDTLRYSIINILAYCLGMMINEYMITLCKNTNSWENEKCFMNMKNEFLFKRAMLTPVKKNYASLQEMQEGHLVAEANQMDIKGLAIDKSTLNNETRDRLKRILYEDILKAETPDQIKLLKSLIIFEKEIYNSLISGSHKYYKPVSIKSMNAYIDPEHPDPLRISGIKAATVWNEIVPDGYEKINLDVKNVVNIVKTDINIKNIQDLKDKDEVMYNKIIVLLNRPRFKDGITSIAVPVNQTLPDVLIPYIDYIKLINDNIGTFPLESMGLYTKDNINYSNIVKL